MCNLSRDDEISFLLATTAGVEKTTVNITATYLGNQESLRVWTCFG